MQDDLMTMLPELEQGKTLYCPVWHIYLTPTETPGEVRRTQYLMESEWAEPETITISALRAGILAHEQSRKEQQAEYKKLQAELNDYDIVLPFGKHKGQKLSEAPASYVQWLAQQEWKSAIPAKAKNYLDLNEFLDGWDGDFDAGGGYFGYDWEVSDQ